MKQLKIDENKALELYPTASTEFKQILEDSFGKEFFIPKSIVDRVKSFEDACEIKCLDAAALIKKWKSQERTEQEISGKKLQLIIEVLNEGFIFDWTNSSQYKYSPYFRKHAGSGWRFVYSASWYSDCFSGAGFYLKSKELSDYCGNQFSSLYNIYLP